MRKYDLTEVITIGSTIRMLLDSGLVSVEEIIEGRRKFRVCLTEKGIEGAKHPISAEKLLDQFSDGARNVEQQQKGNLAVLILGGPSK